MVKPFTFQAIATEVKMKTYKIHVFKGGSSKGTHFEMKASTIQNIRKNLVAKYKNSKTFVDIYVNTVNDNYVGSLKINPKTKETYWFNQGDVEKASCVTGSTGALHKGVCKKKSTKRRK